MAKGFYSKNTTAADDLASKQPPVKQKKIETKEKRSAGRPRIKTEETITIHIAVPVSTHEKLGIAKMCYGNNMTQYVNRLIEKDLNANYEKYQAFVNSFNDLL